MALVDRILTRGIGRLMTTISIDGPRELHDSMRGLPGSWDRGIETLRRLRAIRHRNFQVVAGMTLFAKNASSVDATIAAITAVIPDFERTDLHLNIGHESAHYFSNAGYLSGSAAHPVAEAIEAHRTAIANRLHPVRFLEDRYQALVGRYYETAQVSAALHGARLVDASSIRTGSCIRARSGTSRSAVSANRTSISARALEIAETKDARATVVNEHCPHCWTPCEAYPTILGNLARAVSPFAPSHD